MQVDFWISVFAAAVRLATPILLATLGEIYSERAGLLNLGLEGIMALGAFSCFMTIFVTGNMLLGLVVSVLIGAVVALIHGLLSITLEVDQVVSGLAISIFGVGLGGFLFLSIFGVLLIPPTIPILTPFEVPILSSIPVIGDILFKQSPLVYFGIILAIICEVILDWTFIGMYIKATGENPIAAKAAGINVTRVKYGCNIFGGMTAGLGGAFLVVNIGFFREYMIAGRGWIAIALVVFSSYDPIVALLGSLLFGAGDAYQLRLQAQGVQIPYQLLWTIPYVLTIIALLVVAIREKRRRG